MLEKNTYIIIWNNSSLVRLLACLQREDMEVEGGEWKESLQTPQSVTQTTIIKKM